MAKRSSSAGGKHGTEEAASGATTTGASSGAGADARLTPKKLSGKRFDEELRSLQRELVIMQE
jgi:hypothetical protein